VDKVRRKIKKKGKGVEKSVFRLAVSEDLLALKHS